MIKYVQGNMYTSVKDKNTEKFKKIKSIVDINFQDKLILSVFEGQLSEKDILIKYKKLEGKRNMFRTPKHIHWTIDLMLKREHNEELTNDLLREFKSRWKNKTQLIDRSYNDILDKLYLSKDSTIVQKYSELNNFGYYNIEFLMHLMELLMIQEVTNRLNAYKFNEVLEELIRGMDLFKIISTATYR